jgi:hypothetical protein
VSVSVLPVVNSFADIAEPFIRDGSSGGGALSPSERPLPGEVPGVRPRYSYVRRL